jgi:hypothetical protein
MADRHGQLLYQRFGPGGGELESSMTRLMQHEPLPESVLDNVSNVIFWAYAVGCFGFLRTLFRIDELNSWFATKPSVVQIYRFGGAGHKRIWKCPNCFAVIAVA